MKILTIIDLQNEFDAFTHRAQVLKNVAKLVQSGAYDYIVNLVYAGGPFGEDKPSPNIPEVRKILKGRKNVIKVVKNEDGGGREIIRALDYKIGVRGRGLKIKNIKLDVVGVNTPYCVAETIYDLEYLGVNPKNIKVYQKAVSERGIRRHKRDRAMVLREFKKMGCKII